MELTRKERIRKARIEFIAKEIAKNGPVDYKKFINLSSYKLGVSQRTMKEYIDIAMSLRGKHLVSGMIVDIKVNGTL